MAVVAPTFRAIGSELAITAPDSFISLMKFADSRALGLIMLFAVIIILWFSCFRAPRRFFQRRVAPAFSTRWPSSRSSNYIACWL